MHEDMDFNEQLDRVVSGAHVPVGSSTETDWHGIWMNLNVGDYSPLTMALVGGALADRPAWVFHAGYQGMMRYAFPFCPTDGWASYLLAEDKTGEYPGTVVTKSDGRITLSGSKSWVAASDHVNHLVVQLRDEDILMLVDRDDPGVSLSSRDKPGFLGDLSQGFATFEQVAIDDDRLFSSEHLPANFSQSEPHHVLTALNAFMISQTLRLGGDSNIQAVAASSVRNARDLVERNATGDDFFLGIADLDEETTGTARFFESFIESRDADLYQRWQKDRGLVNMFSRGLQKRAAWLRKG